MNTFFKDISTVLLLLSWVAMMCMPFILIGLAMWLGL